MKCKMKDKPLSVLASVRNFDSLPDSAFVRFPTVCCMFSISPATGWRWIKSGRLPSPHKIGPRASGFKVADLRHVLSQGKSMEHD